MKRLANDSEMIPSGTFVIVERVPIEYAEVNHKGHPHNFAGNAATGLLSTIMVKPNERADTGEAREAIPEICLPYFSKPDFLKGLDECRFFVMRSANMENIIISRQQNQWATTKNNETKLNEAFSASPHVFLFFVVSKISNLQGIARMTSLITHKSSSFWRNVELIKLGGCFKVQWLSYAPLSSNRTANIRNALNENQPVFLSRDCTELDRKAGRELSLLIDIPFKEKASGQEQNPRNDDVLLKQSFTEDRRRTEGDSRPIFDVLYRYIPNFRDSIQSVDAENLSTIYNKLSRLVKTSYDDTESHRDERRKDRRRCRDRDSQANIAERHHRVRKNNERGYR